VKTDMRIRMQERTHAYRHDLHKRLREADENPEEKKQEITQFQILEEYAATVEGALNLESQAPFQYGGLAMQEALSKIQASLEKLEKELLCQAPWSIERNRETFYVKSQNPERKNQGESG
jgi:hypothetical protein